MPTIAFDMGGVLLTDGSQTAWGTLERKFGIPARQSSRLWYEELQRPADRGEIGEEEIWSALEPLARGAAWQQIREAFLSEYVPIDRGVHALRQASSAGWDVLLATNNVSSWVEYWREKYDWMLLPDATICSGDIGVRKPDPSFYEALATATKKWPAWFVDDKSENLAPAKELGFIPVRASADSPWELPRFAVKGEPNG